MPETRESRKPDPHEKILNALVSNELNIALHALKHALRGTNDREYIISQSSFDTTITLSPRREEKI